MPRKKYLKNILTELSRISRKDANIMCLFVHGSVVYKTATYKNYSEIMLFEKDKFLGSIFRLQKINPDIDMICVSTNPNATNEIFKAHFRKVNSFFLTMNIMTPEIFIRELDSDSPTAIKRILSTRKLHVIKSRNLISEYKRIAKKNLRELDSNFQKEYQFRKEYLKLHIRNQVDSFIMPVREYERLFPIFTQFVQGKISAGFPPERIKLVLPKPMNLKSRIDITTNKIVYLE